MTTTVTGTWQRPRWLGTVLFPRTAGAQVAEPNNQVEFDAAAIKPTTEVLHTLPGGQWRVESTFDLTNAKPGSYQVIVGEYAAEGNDKEFLLVAANGAAHGLFTIT